ncbi:MAG: haloacid dehalogenase type II [Gammaproteobacteria bacterium]|nr:haloacid dehalogenase type II [Gammaproteobacteria bacterium]
MERDTILFDINETVLDLSSLQPKFESAFGNPAVTGSWFSMLLHSSTVCILTNVKSDFGTLAGTMLDTISARLGIELPAAAREDILSSFASLPPHADIKPALDRLRSAGYRTVSFTNSSLKLVTSQITNAGLLDYFDELVSVEETGSFKPDPRVYQFVADRLNRPIETLRLVATHDWDTHGALTAGMHAAYIDRSAAPYHPQYLEPDVYATSMQDLAERIIVKDGKQ